MTMSTKDYIQQHPALKRILYRVIMHPVKTRPNWWMRPFRWLYFQRGRGSVIYRSVRADITPFHPFVLGQQSVIEDFCCVNNAVGEIRIGDHTRIGLHNTVIGPVRIGSDVNLAQGVVVSGLNHRFADPGAPIARQGVNTALTVIDDDVWIGANAVVTAGVHIGRHSVIGAGSVVTKDVPAGSVAVGNPARVIKSILPSEKSI
jgi:acetyltransferase-like isoleucine patch superfamily enzyme